MSLQRGSPGTEFRPPCARTRAPVYARAGARVRARMAGATWARGGMDSPGRDAARGIHPFRRF